MKKQELFASIVVSFLAGSVLLLTLLGNANLNKGSTLTMAAEDLTPTVPPALPIELTPTLQEQAIEAGSKKEQDIEDVLLLYDASRPSGFDADFCKIAEYYGLLCKSISINATDITDRALRDAQGNYYKIIGVDATNLPLFSSAEIAMLKSIIANGGVSLFISGVNNSAASLSELTNGRVSGSKLPADNTRDWIVSSADSEITREFTGQNILSSTTDRQNDFALLVDQPADVTTLISSISNDGTEYPIFVRCQLGNGSIFIDSAGGVQSLANLSLREMYYDPSNFSAIVPLMLVVRYTAGEEAWHSNHDYANLTLDDPTLTEPYYDLSYPALLREMQASNFHTTIAIIPAKWQSFDLDIVDLFKQHPDHFSIVQHGNNHDGYEFYKYILTEGDPQDNADYRARPLSEQEADIAEGLSRLQEMSRILELPFEQIMVFPNGISPQETLSVLKKYNYLGTVNAQDVPLNATRPSNWDYGMYPTELGYENFPTLLRRHPGTYLPFKPNIQPFVLDLFIDKPALFYSHAYDEEIFAEGVDGFDVVANQMNGLEGSLEWNSLGYILKHLYLEKTNDDGSIDIRMFTNRLVFSNETQSTQVYHIFKSETFSAPSIKLIVNEREIPFQINNGLLMFDMEIPAGLSIDIDVHYGD